MMDTVDLVRQEQAKIHRMIDDLPDPKTLHQLIDELPIRQLIFVEMALQALRDLADPVQRALNTAPLDDEPVTPEERQAIQNAEEELLHHPPQVRTLEEVRRELGL
jgi:hypothetical protein